MCPTFWLRTMFTRFPPFSHFIGALHTDNIDRVALQELFSEYDSNRDGSITVSELEKLLVDLGVAPLKEMSKLSSASSDKNAKAKENETL